MLRGFDFVLIHLVQNNGERTLSSCLDPLVIGSERFQGDIVEELKRKRVGNPTKPMWTVKDFSRQAGTTCINKALVSVSEYWMFLGPGPGPPIFQRNATCAVFLHQWTITRPGVKLRLGCWANCRSRGLLPTTTHHPVFPSSYQWSSSQVDPPLLLADHEAPTITQKEGWY